MVSYIVSEKETVLGSCNAVLQLASIACGHMISVCHRASMHMQDSVALKHEIRKHYGGDSTWVHTWPSTTIHSLATAIAATVS